MGIYNSKIENKAIINCDNKQNIVNCNDFIYILLNYSQSDLVGKHITILMSPLLTLIHKKMFKMINSREENEINKIKPKIRNHKNNLRHFYIYDSLQNPVLCSVDVHINNDLTTTVILEKIEQFGVESLTEDEKKFLDNFEN